jgi:UrcA family protein
VLKVSRRYAAVVAALGAVVIGSFGAVPAQAAQREVWVASVAVPYGDLDLDNAAGVNALYKRLRGAAERVCDHPAGRSLADILAYRACFKAALTGAVRDVNSEALSNLHQRATVRAS